MGLGLRLGLDLDLGLGLDLSWGSVAYHPSGKQQQKRRVMFCATIHLSWLQPMATADLRAEATIPAPSITISLIQISKTVHHFMLSPDW